MKYRYPVILAVLVILIAMAVSGCTSSGSSETSTPVASPTIGPSASTPANPASTASTLASLYQVGNFKWYEYNMTTSGGILDAYYAYDIASYGSVSSARHLKHNMTIDDYTETYDLYYDGNKFLGGQRKYLLGIDTLGPYSWGGENLDNAIEMSRVGTKYAIRNEGQDTVTVRAGTFTCTKYTVSNGGLYTGTYWASAEVPVPIKIVLTNQDPSNIVILNTFELVGWG